MKTPSLDLFELIHSFSIYERRTFIELFSNTNNKDKNYLLLFREICKQKQYDETILKKKFKNNIYFKQLKSNLYGIMLRFINYSSIHKNDYQEIHAMLQRFEQLFHKKLFSILRKEMIIAEHLAFKTEDFLSMLTILKWKRELYIVENIGGKIKNYHANIYIKEKEYLNCYTNLVEYKNIYITIFSYTLIQAEKIEKSTLDNLLTIKNNKLIKSEKYALSQTAKLLFHKINCDIYFLLKDWKKNYYHNKQQLNIVKSGCFSPKEVLRAYGNMAIPLKKLSLNKEFELIKDELFNYYNKQPNHIKSFDVENQFIVFMNNYVSYQLVNNTKNGIKIGVLLNNIIEKSTLISSKLVFYVNMSIAYFFEQNFKQALSFSTKILMNEKSHFRKDIISFTMIMASVLYYELEDFDLMLYQINHFLNHFNSEENKDEAALIFLNYLKTVGKEGAINSQLKNQQLLALKYKILPFDIKNNEMSFDIICWIDSKLQNRTFHEQLITSKLNIIKIIDMH